MIRWMCQSETDLPRTDAWLSEREAERAGRMRFTKRRVDYLLGRWTAKTALARALGRRLALEDLADIEVRNADDGAPEAFVAGEAAPLVLSITDRAGWGVCAVRESGPAIGCDLEVVEPRSAAFVADYLTASERSVVASARSEDERNCRANLLWCAKESALKVLRTGLRRDTRSVEVTLDAADPRDGWSALVVRDEQGRAFPGWWRRYGCFVLSFAAEVATPPPEPMLDPAVLDGAAPIHDWMRAPRTGA